MLEAINGIRSEEYLIFDKIFQAEKISEQDSYISFLIGINCSQCEFAVSMRSNSKSGTLSSEWISFPKIKQFLENSKEEFDTKTFNSLFQFCNNNNNAGFIAAVLMAKPFKVIQKNTNEFKYKVVENYMDRFDVLEAELRRVFTQCCNKLGNIKEQ